MPTSAAKAPGLGYNLNLPLPRKSGDDGVPGGAGRRAPAHPRLCAGRAGRGARARRVRRRSVRRAVGHDAGLCAHRRGDRRACGLPTVIVQEGGYLCDALGDNLTAFLTGFGGGKKR